MQRTCEKCGKPFEAKRSSARFCSGKCRTAASREGGGQQRPTVAALPTGEGDEQPPPSQPDILPPLVVAIWRELEQAGRLNTAKGQLTLQLAMDRATAGQFDNLSQRAAATREIRASLDAALAGAKPPADALDELEKRRREKAARA